MPRRDVRSIKANRPATLSHTPNEEVPPLAPNTALKCQKRGRWYSIVVVAMMCVRIVFLSFFGGHVRVLSLQMKTVFYLLMHQQYTYLDPNHRGIYERVCTQTCSTKTLLTNYLPNHVDRLCCDILHTTAIKGMIQILIMCSYINKDKKRHRKVFTYHTAGVIAKRRAIQTSLPACAYLIKVNINFPKITFCFDPRFKFSVVFLVV